MAAVAVRTRARPRAGGRPGLQVVRQSKMLDDDERHWDSHGASHPGLRGEGAGDEEGAWEEAHVSADVIQPQDGGMSFDHRGLRGRFRS